MKANKEFKNEICICKNCGKEFHPRYSSMGIYCSNACQHEFQAKQKYQDYLNNPDAYFGQSNMR